MKKYNIEKINAKDPNRPELKLMIDFIKKGKSIVIDYFNRLVNNRG